jgi:hypothetical protein
MRLQSLFFVGVLAATAIPLAARAQPSPVNGGAAASAQAVESAQACAPGWVWEPEGYTGRGYWRPAHCAPRTSGY